MDRDELQQDRLIDPNELDIEAVQQADLYCKWAERLALAKNMEEELEFELGFLEAKLQMACRKDPDSFGVVKDAETAIKSAVRCHPKYVELARQYQRARKEAALLATAEKALSQKKQMIEELVKLHGQQYFAGPSVPRDIVSAWQAHKMGRTESVIVKLSEVVRKRVQIKH